jgi:glycosyltransferase involved in cell wall biosynthesis
MKIIVDSSCNILYSSYYLYEFLKTPKYKLTFKNYPFKALEHNNQYLALIATSNDINKKIIIDFSNFDRIDQKALEWSDVYGKVNLNPKDLHIKKIVAIGPLTAINIFNKSQTLYLSIFNYLKSKKRIKNVKQHFSYYKGQLNRPLLSDYQQQEIEHDYIFFASSLWKKETVLNKIRSYFIKTCMNHPKIEFEGGFAPRTNGDISGYENLTMKSRVSNKEFIAKTSASKFVFNAPSVGSCNGWRLTEYLAMGKAIISTDFLRIMPNQFEDRTHFLLVSGTENDFIEKIELLLTNKKLVHTLEKNSKKYFEKELAPNVVINRLLRKPTYVNH